MNSEVGPVVVPEGRDYAEAGMRNWAGTACALNSVNLVNLIN